MSIRRPLPWTLAFVLVSGVAHAETEAECKGPDCEYRFDDEALNSPGWSPYGDWFKVRGRAPKSMLIRPRVSFVVELLQSMNRL